MGKNRLEAFSDGVLAIIITIMVLEMKVPHGDNLKTLAPLVPVFMSYVLSFVYLGIYWNNHHHMLHTEHPGHRRHSLGQPASAFLAVAVSVCHWLDGRESLRRVTYGTLRRGTPGGGRCLLDTSADDYCSAGTGFTAENGNW